MTHFKSAYDYLIDYNIKGEIGIYLQGAVTINEALESDEALFCTANLWTLSGDTGLARIAMVFQKYTRHIYFRIAIQFLNCILYLFYTIIYLLFSNTATRTGVQWERRKTNKDG